MSRISSETAVTSLVDADVLLVDNPTLGTRKVAHSDLKAQYEIVARKGVADGYAALDANGLVPAAQLRPALVPELAATEAAKNALTVVSGDIGKRIVYVTESAVSYLAMTAGAGADKWAPYSSEPAASTSAPGIVQLAASADAETNDLKALTIAEFLRRLGPYRNALAPSGGLAFDGNSSGGVTATLTNQNIATDSFALTFVVKPATAAPVGVSETYATLYDSGSPYSVTVRGETGGQLRVLLFGASGSDFVRWTLAGWFTNYGGKEIQVSFVRNASGNPTIYFNGGDVTSSGSFDSAGSCSWQGSVTSTYFGAALGGAFILRRLSLYNLALAPADVTEIYELGGAVPERFKFGSQATITGDPIVNGIAGNNAYGTFSGASSTGFTAADTSGFHAASIGAAISTVLGSKVRVKATLTLNSGGAPSVGLFTSGVSGMSTGDAALSAGVNSVELTATQLNATARLSFFRTGATDFVLTDVKSQRLGAVVHYDADLDGIGYQLHDQSTNKLHARLTTTGVSWTKAATMGYVKALSDGTTSAQALGGGTILPANCQIVRVRARSISGTPSITLGTSSGGSQIVASVALSTTWKDLTIALTGGINTAAASLWMTASAANVVEVQLAYEQLPA